MLSSTSSFDRAVPVHRWRRMAALTVGLLLLFVWMWESHWRSQGYKPAYNSSEGLWAFQRERVKKDDTVIIGDSRTRFDLDLDVWEKEAGGRRPVMLGIDGSCVRPILAHLAGDENFAGTVICNVTEPLFFLPGGPLMARSTDRLKYYENRTVAQVASDFLAMGLESQLAFLQKEDLSLNQLLNQLRLPNREGCMLPPEFPPQLGFVTADNRSVMMEKLEKDKEFQDRIKKIWLGIMGMVQPLEPKMRDELLEGVVKDVERIRARGGRVIFLRLPSTGEYLEIEKQKFPRADYWDVILARTGAPGIHFEDHEPLQGFDCPEWSHLTAADAVVFTERLVSVLKEKQLLGSSSK